MLRYDQRQSIAWLLIVALTAILATLSCLKAFALRQPTPKTLRSGISANRELQGDDLKCNGLVNLCDLSVSEVVFATAHNANAALENWYWIFPNHIKELESALDKGYRGLNMDIGICKNELKFFHQVCALGTRDMTKVLSNIVDFLNENPHEVLILPTELAAEVKLADIQDVFDSVEGWNEQLYAHPGPGAPWPTLRELIEANTRVLFFHYNGESCNVMEDCPPGFHPWFDYAVETRFSFKSISKFKDKEHACEITRGQNGTRDFFGVNVFVTLPRKWAAYFINKAWFLRPHLDACSEINGGLPVNVVLNDFWSIGDTIKVVQMMNAEL